MKPRFRCHPCTFRHFDSHRLPDPHLTHQVRLFPRRSPQRSSANAAVGGLEPPPAGRLRRAYLHLPRSTASRSSTYRQPPSAFVTHHSAYRSAPGLRDQTNKQANESGECRGGEARAELGQEPGQRARRGGAGWHRRITLTRTVNERSMLASSRSKIHEPRVPGVSPRPTDQRQRQKLRNTRDPVGAENPATSCDLEVF